MEVNRAATTERVRAGESVFSPVVKQYSEINIMENYVSGAPKQEQAITRIRANNISKEPVERIDVYMSGRKTAVLGTDFQAGYLDTSFFSSVRDVTPYTLKAIVSQGAGRCSSGDITIQKAGYLDIDIGQTVIMMNHYADRARTELIASAALTPTVSHPDQGNHPLA
jgi:hypothetical protein